ncbi:MULTISPECIES: bifunctional 2-polyprenyl-6-hydroxyphenol methylase/3-demethylubiquinol 3-O-methyltransferase UbiG [Inquilinus]|uniref:Ubiquinone biosynthesis O-methyltransferase n=1 Tax=Inquilinus ginsengisoli TaxID=363840 RepID=A0ABU1JUY0_9PROT|nr:bifunctional 2-polyprenyl-6-hydroxyphenol methylase/3-demethylubiquinol 3-O-methyltransferase UbiG [Inquilinus ginsengisoli]MDR6292426.1 2-polyprenyl-6-hydroxyphenyl methylase/3-demethylubiquinone-9 3-methyltransferase [Inquilinus ginsengisoli]
MAQSPAATVDSAEIARFESMAADWWDPDGKFRPLHSMNPLRIGYIRDRLCARLGRDPLAPKPLAGLRVLDIGCGGGLLSEPMARLGAEVTGVDAGAEAIGVARAHAAESGLAIDYRHGSAEDLAASGARFDAVLALEIVEHVADVDAFCGALSTLLRPGGTLAMSTLNRTSRSWTFAILGAEYLLRMIPRGTHDWKKFLKPHELAAALRRSGLAVGDIAGMVPDPRRGDWRLAPRDLAVNYILTAAKPG